MPLLHRQIPAAKFPYPKPLPFRRHIRLPVSHLRTQRIPSGGPQLASPGVSLKDQSMGLSELPRSEVHRSTPGESHNAAVSRDAFAQRTSTNSFRYGTRDSNPEAPATR